MQNYLRGWFEPALQASTIFKKMDSVTWYRYARYYAENTSWIVRRPNKDVFSSEKRKELNQKATRITFFAITISAFWFLFFQLLIGQYHTETLMLAAGSSVAFSMFGKGWGILNKIIE
ncbi:hypothetical protein ACFL96_14385 [Thermoproteota archaeon]